MMRLAIILYMCVASLLLFALTRWAMQGDGYWPRGPLGVLLAFIFLLGAMYVVPAYVISLRQMTPVLWIIPPLHDVLPPR